MRANLFAKATATSFGGFFGSILANHEPAGAPYLLAQRTTAVAPRTRSRRRSRCPILEILPSRSLPPEEFCFGVRPIQAAKSRPLEKVSADGAKASIAVAQIAPTPGIVINREATSARLARVRSSFSRTAIFSERNTACSNRLSQRILATSGRSGCVAISSFRLGMCLIPWGTIRPYSARCPRNALTVCVRCRTNRSRTLNAMAEACFSALLTPRTALWVVKRLLQ